MKGVPTGIRWVRKCLRALNQIKRIFPTQKE